MRGPLNIARPVQGWPVIVQAGASEDGRQLAAETAEAVFTGGGSLSDGQKLYADIKGRMDKLGRDREHLKILPGAFVVVGDSVEEARKSARCSTAGCITTARSLRSRCSSAPMPPASIPTANCRRSRRPMPVKERAPAAGRCSPRATSSPCANSRSASAAMAGYPLSARLQTIADQMEEWLTSFGCDGFNIMFPFLPAGLDDFVDKVVPELQRRGIFRTEYEGRTLRENLGLPRPKNRFFEA